MRTGLKWTAEAIIVLAICILAPLALDGLQATGTEPSGAYRPDALERYASVNVLQEKRATGIAMSYGWTDLLMTLALLAVYGACRFGWRLARFRSRK